MEDLYTFSLNLAKNSKIEKMLDISNLKRKFWNCGNIFLPCILLRSRMIDRVHVLMGLTQWDYKALYPTDT